MKENKCCVCSFASRKSHRQSAAYRCWVPETYENKKLGNEIERWPNSTT